MILFPFRRHARPFAAFLGGAAAAWLVGPSSGAVLNLTSTDFGSDLAPDILVAGSGSTFRGGFINGALFRDPSVEGSAGSGVFRDLYRLTPPNTKGAVTESGYNRPTMDSKIPGGFDPIIRVGDLIQDATESAYIFVVDVNEKNSDPDNFISLDDFKIWVGGADDPETLPNSLTGLSNDLGLPVYDLQGQGGNNTVFLDARLSSGSGGGDMFVFVPKQLFGNDPNALVYIYTAFGGYSALPGFGAGETSEQVSIPGKSLDGTGGITTVSTIGSGVPVPEPGTLGFVLASLWLIVRRRR